MSVVKKTLEENYLFFIRELSRIDDEIRSLPGGSISAKKIGKTTYYYHQWREGKRVRSVSLGTDIPPGLLQTINRRKLLEGQRKQITQEIAVIAKAIDTQRVTVDDVIKVFSQNGIRVILIGSYCIPILKEELKLNLCGKGTDKAVYIKPLKIRATPLRYLRMLFDEQMEVEKEGYKFVMPSPWVLAYHKILIAKNRRAKDKKEKDMMQATAILREIFKRPDELKKALSYLETLPPKWKNCIKGWLAEYMPDISSEM